MYLRSVELLSAKIENRDQYPFDIPAIRSLERLEITNNVTFFVGENGSGKSTLLEGIAHQCGFNTAGGGRNNTYETHASESSLGNYLRLAWLPKITNGFFMRSESFYQFASHVDEMPESLPYYGGRSLHEQSHGESFLSLFVNRFSSKGIYLLDEPEAALSPARQLSLLRILHDLSGTSQFIIATHSPILLGYPGAEILSFDDNHIQEVVYEDTDHYQITRSFLENRDRMLNELFKD
ncbi:MULTISPECIES: AAA family ATPase [unclassified Paenibacillus]|uniref:AAA family ATPase n=1 Tax=unclassified Paenibacillus TaxID=185978 RepID=UPI000CFCA720|nr:MULTISPECIES: AAA family ATPase [unclassified Paenibacillus]PRA08713.1 AAA family ATPase [Paenibacillus sp. MYb63]PRA48647.1 AAA family ATPase [Paenibacillus sp. MYb67]QZN72988.1 AAA family ATPase [Paenibacillus sp. DR312]